MFFTLLVGGLISGSIYGITGMGYSLIYKASGLMNLSQGELLMLGAYFGYTLYGVLGLPFPLALVITAIFMFIIGYLMNSAIITRLLNKNGNLSSVILCTMAISMIFQNGTRLIWGSNSKNFPNIFDLEPIPVFGTAIAYEQILVLVMAIICMFTLHIFMTKTVFGTGMRAAALDSEAASVLGINVQRTKGITWGISSALAGIIGCTVGPLMSVFSTMGAIIGNKAFGSAVIGGYGNVYGTLLGGVLYGIVETLIAGYVSTSFKDMISFALLIVCLIFMPNGIFNEKVLE